MHKLANNYGVTTATTVERIIRAETDTGLIQHVYATAKHLDTVAVITVNGEQFAATIKSTLLETLTNWIANNPETLTGLATRHRAKYGESKGTRGRWIIEPNRAEVSILARPKSIKVLAERHGNKVRMMLNGKIIEETNLEGSLEATVGRWLCTTEALAKRNKTNA